MPRWECKHVSNLLANRDPIMMCWTSTAPTPLLLPPFSSFLLPLLPHPMYPYLHTLIPTLSHSTSTFPIPPLTLSHFPANLTIFPYLPHILAFSQLISQSFPISPHIIAFSQLMHNLGVVEMLFTSDGQFSLDDARALRPARDVLITVNFQKENGGLKQLQNVQVCVCVCVCARAYVCMRTFLLVLLSCSFFLSPPFFSFPPLFPPHSSPTNR